MYRPIAFIAIATLLLFAVERCAAADARPNLVVFISDDHGHLDSSVAGASEFQTPNLNRLASDGMTLTHAFAASPSCAPSRAAFLTGLMPMRNGAMLNHQPPRGDVNKLPAYLHALGYEVVAFGKVAHYRQGKLYGFDHVSHDTFHDDTCVAAAVAYLQQWSGDRPLCLFVGTNWPHVPWPESQGNVVRGSPDPAIGNTVFVPPPTHVDTPATRHWRARYAAAIEQFDGDLGLVYDAVYERLGPHTLFIHFSDHGAQWPFGKWNLYDAGTRVPFFAVWPGVIRPGSQSDAMLNLVDLLPTLVEAAGGDPPADLDGQSFAAVLTGQSSEHRDRIFTTHSGDGHMNAYPIRSVRTRHWKYILNLRPESEHHTHIDSGKDVDGNAYWRSWIAAAETDQPAAKIVGRYYHRPAEELYDLRSDPLEQHNLAADSQHNETLRQLRDELDAWLQQQGDEGLETERNLHIEKVE